MRCLAARTAGTAAFGVTPQRATPRGQPRFASASQPPRDQHHRAARPTTRPPARRRTHNALQHRLRAGREGADLSSSSAPRCGRRARRHGTGALAARVRAIVSAGLGHSHAAPCSRSNRLSLDACGEALRNKLITGAAALTASPGSASGTFCRSSSPSHAPHALAVIPTSATGDSPALKGGPAPARRCAASCCRRRRSAPAPNGSSASQSGGIGIDDQGARPAGTSASSLGSSSAPACTTIQARRQPQRITAVGDASPVAPPIERDARSARLLRPAPEVGARSARFALSLTPLHCRLMPARRARTPRRLSTSAPTARLRLRGRPRLANRPERHPSACGNGQCRHVAQ